MDTAWNMFFSKRSSHIPDIQAIFIDKAPSDYIESRQFSVLHDAVLSLDKNSSRRLSDVFKTSGPMDIEARDARGLTALAWAATLDDRLSVRCLLNYGADPNSRDNKMVTPLMRTRDDKCLRMLLAKGADVNARDNLRQTPLLATEHSSVECAEVLLDNGATIDLPQYTGFTPLHYFVQNSEADLVQLLISRGADYTLRANDGSSIVHSAFRWADAKTLLTLARNNLQSLNLNQKDDRGVTGSMLAETRRRQDSELCIAIDAFEESLRKMQMKTLETAAPTDKEALRDRGMLHRISLSNVEAQTFRYENLGKTIRGRARQTTLSLVVGFITCIAFWTWFTMGTGFMLDQISKPVSKTRVQPRFHIARSSQC